MRLLILLLLIGNFCFGQKTLTIVDDSNAPISGVSVFLIGKTNVLVAISDEKGTINLELGKTSNYLLHALGFEDVQLGSEDLQDLASIKLKTSKYLLKEVKVGSLLKIFVVKKPVRPNFNVRTIIDIPQDVNKQRIISIQIDTPGYLKSLKLFCRVQVKDVVPDYRFLLIGEKNGEPSDLLIPLKIEGKKSKKEIVFDLSKTNYYLEKGTYFIGYETFNGKVISKKQIYTDKKFGKMISVPIVIFCSEEKKISFNRTNLSKWRSQQIGHLVDGKMVWNDDLEQNFAYELEMLY